MKVTLSAGERLILLMLCEIYEHLKIKGETDTKLIKEAIFSGNIWGLEWELTGVFHGDDCREEVVSETVDILQMWERLEQSFIHLSTGDKASLTDLPFGDDLRFPGFDGNNECDHISVAHFLVDTLGRFKHFKGRAFDAHMQTLDGHRRMLVVFQPILQQVLNKDFSSSQIADVLKVWRSSE